MSKHASDRLLEFRCRSRFVPGVCEVSVMRLVGQSWRESLALGVTGSLRRDGDMVEQIIEGPREIVLPLIARILCDRRHGSIEIVAFGPIASRACAEWTVEGCPDQGLAARNVHDETANVVSILRAPSAMPVPALRVAFACGT